MSTTSATDSSPQDSPPLLPPFSKSARYYDALYSGKDYAAEAAVYDAQLTPARQGGSIATLLEFGCGTGGFARELAKLGWHVTGVDKSAEMIRLANSEWLAARQGDISSPRLFSNARFSHKTPVLPAATWNAVCAPFAVLSYSCFTTPDFAQTLRNARQALRAGGRFVFDVTHYSAAMIALRDYEVREAAIDGGSIKRVMRKRFDPITALVNYEMEFTVTAEGSAVEEWREHHNLRAFTVQEIRFALEQFGFELVFVGDVTGGAVRIADWHVLFVAEAVD